MIVQKRPGILATSQSAYQGFTDTDRRERPSGYRLMKEKEHPVHIHSYDSYPGSLLTAPDSRLRCNIQDLSTTTALIPYSGHRMLLQWMLKPAMGEI
jgi:hypothetical protein